MSNSLSQKEYTSQFENLVRSMIKDMLETMMKEELKQVIENEKKELHLLRNGYYTRDLDTRFGQIEDLKVPRDRQNLFQTQFLSPYQRRDAWLEEAIIRMYASGMSTRDECEVCRSLGRTCLFSYHDQQYYRCRCGRDQKVEGTHSTKTLFRPLSEWNLHPPKARGRSF